MKYRLTPLFCGLLAAATPLLAAQPPRPTVTIPNASLGQVKNAFSTWCLTHTMDIAESDDNRMACTKPIEGGRGFLIQALNGNGAAPLIRLEISYASTGSSVIVTAKQQMQTQRANGVVERIDFRQKQVIAGTQGILDDVAITLTPASPAMPNGNPPNPTAAPQSGN